MHIHQVQITAQLGRRVDLLLVILLLWVHILLLQITLSVLYLSLLHSLNTSCLRRMRMTAMRMSMRMIMAAFTTCRNPQALIHSHKSHESNQNRNTQQQVPVRLNQHKLCALVAILANENLGKQVEQGIAQQAAHGKGDHDGQRRRVDVGRAKRQQEVGRAGDVQGREDGIDGGRAGEEDGEEALGGGRGLLGVRGDLFGGEGLDYWAILLFQRIVTC